MKLTAWERASKGGLTGARNQTPEQRTVRARKAGNATLAKYGKEYFSKIRQGLKVKDF